MKIAGSESGAVLSKSATLVKQDGNPLPRFINKIKLETYCDGALNSEGLPNAGINYCKNRKLLELSRPDENPAYFLDISEDSKEKIKEFGKPYIVSLSGLSLNDNLEMLDRAYDSGDGIAAIELNLACPNIPGKPVVSNDFEQMDRVLRSVVENSRFGQIPLGIKLGPYFDMPFFERAAEIIAKHPVRFVTSVNTIGNALFVDSDNECEAIAANHGLGGLGGGFVKHTALANVRTMRTLLDARGRHDIDLVGVGGVHTGRDAFELILCGARAVQVGTCYWTEGPACFARIAGELRQLMERKGYSSVEAFRGRLKPYVPPSRTTELSAEIDASAGRKEDGKVKHKKEVEKNDAVAVVETKKQHSREQKAGGDVEDDAALNLGELSLRLCYILLGAAFTSLLNRLQERLGL
jgi:dihydroorotate dehydrogenase (fumarate)